MKSQNRIAIIAAFAFAAVCASAVPASAQSACKGSFTLSHQVRWQNVTLPAGDYTFDMQSVNTPSRMIVKGPNGSQFIAAVVADEKTGEDSMLIVENRATGSYVKELRLSAIGRTFRYSVPKAPKDVELAQGPATTERILVAVNVK
jgi:hypothetical protein